MYYHYNPNLSLIGNIAAAIIVGLVSGAISVAIKRWRG